MVIRERADADLPACVELLERVRVGDGYPLQLAAHKVDAFLASKHLARAWVAELDGRIAGHVALHCPAQDPTLEVAERFTGLPASQLALVARLFVAPDVRRAGVGRAMLRHAAGGARWMGRRAVLDVGQTLHKAVALYESERWERVGELHHRLDAGVMLDLWVYVSPSSDLV